MALEFDPPIEDPGYLTLGVIQKALSSGDGSATLEMAEEYLENHPLDLQALNLCAVAASRMGDDEKALHLYAKAIHFEPNNSAFQLNYGILLQALGRYETALVHMLRTIDLQPDFADAYLYLGQVHDALGHYKDALKCYDEAERRLYRAPDLHYSRGVAHNRQERFGQALVCFEKALELNGEDGAVFNGIGFAQAGLSRHAEAIESYSHAIERLPADEPSAHFNRGVSKVRLGADLEGALDDFSEALSRNPEFFEAYIEKAGVLCDLGRYDEALIWLDNASELDPGNAYPAYCRGIVLERRGDLEGALDALDESLKLDPESIYALNNRGNILMHLGRLDEALCCFDAVIARASDYPLAHYNRACLFARRGKVREAVRSLSKASDGDRRFLQEAQKDLDFDPIRHSASFIRLLQQAG